MRLNEGLGALGAWAFKGAGLREVTVPASVREIWNGAFQNCLFLQSISFAPDSQLECVGESAFADSGLGTFVAPASLREIEGSAFRNCRRL